MGKSLPFIIITLLAVVGPGQTMSRGGDEYLQTVWTTEEGLPNGFVWALNQDPEGTIWVGGQNGAARFVNGRWQSFTTRDGLPDAQVWAIQADERGQLQFAGGGFARFNGAKFVATQDPALDLLPTTRRVGRAGPAVFWSTPEP